MNQYAQQIFEKGYCVLESLYDENECEAIISILCGVWKREGRPKMGGRFGYILHPALKYVPNLAPFYTKREAIDVMRCVFDDEVRMAHSGALLMDETRDFCMWHAHLNGDKFTRWYPKPEDHRGQVDRVLCNVYLHGSNQDVGQLLVYPRKTAETWERPFSDVEIEWPNQQVLEFPPGSAVIFDVALWHAARRPTKPGIRYLWGGHYQGMSNLAPHREDNWYNGPEIEKYRADIPAFASLTSVRATSV